MTEAAQSSPEDPFIGRVLNERYRIEGPLGEGGIGRVYRARHLTVGNHVALKVLQAQYENLQVLRDRFSREVEALARLKHPNIVTVQDYGVDNDVPYLVMELLDGTDLSRLIAKDVIEPRRVLDIFKQILRALAYAHEQGLVHRDLKPQNVFVRPVGGGAEHVEVLDFGLARFMDDEQKGRAKLTRTGALIGTPAYMAPEQATGDKVDARADVYAAGLVLYEMLCGRRPFPASDPGEQLRSHLLMEPPPIERVDGGLELTSGMQGFLRKSLAKQPRDRYANATEMLAALDALGPEPARRIGPRARHGDADLGTAATRVASPAAARAQSGSIPQLPGSRWPLFAGIGVAAFLLAAGGFALALVITQAGDGDERAVPPPPRTLPATPTPSQPRPGPTATPAPARRPARDPFAGGPLPEPLASYHASVQLGRRLSESQLSDLRARTRESEMFVPARLILAHHLANQRKLSDAMPHYREVHDRDPSARGDPRMLADLIMMATVNTDSLRVEATTAIVDWYGDEALPAVQAQIARPAWPGPTATSTGRRVQGYERERLEALRDRLVAGEG